MADARDTQRETQAGLFADPQLLEQLGLDRQVTQRIMDMMRGYVAGFAAGVAVAAAGVERGIVHALRQLGAGPSPDTEREGMVVSQLRTAIEALVRQEQTQGTE